MVISLKPRPQAVDIEPLYQERLSDLDKPKIGKNLVSIQFLRFVAATLVVMFHSTVAIERYFPGILPRALLNEAVLGASGVHIFFVISGFIMVRASFADASTNFVASDFAIRRLIRIYPIYLIYAALYLCFYYELGVGKNLSHAQLIGALLLLPGYSSDIIGPGWTLSYELYFYLCFAAAMLLGLTRGLVVLTIFFGFSIGARLFIVTGDPAIHIFTNSLLAEFLLGAWIGHAVVRGVVVMNRWADVMLLAALSTFLAGTIYGYGHLPSTVMWGVPSALLVGGLIFRERNGAIPSQIRRVSFLGDSSYSLYLLHILLIDAILFMGLAALPTTVVKSFGAFELVGLCVGLTLVCIFVAVVSYELIEAKVIDRLQSIRKGRSADFRRNRTT